MYFEKNPKAGPIIAIIAYMYNHFSKLFVVQQLKDSKAIKDALGWVPPDVSSGAKYYSLQKTTEILHLLCEYDAKAKGLYATGNNSNADLLKELTSKKFFRLRYPYNEKQNKRVSSDCYESQYFFK